MLLRGFLAGLCLANALHASPIQQKDSNRGIVRFKRDAALTPRDLELAEMHSVNLTEMWKHSVVKRNDGDHVTIWVHNSFEEHEAESDVSKRQTAHLWPGAHFGAYANFPSTNCGRNAVRWDITSVTSPFSGGVLAMRDWAASHRGLFKMGRDGGTMFGPGPKGFDWRTILIGGSNSGRNARYRMALKRVGAHNTYTWVDSLDLVNDLNWTHDRKKQFDGGRWRAASHGEQTCGTLQTGSPSNTQEYQIISFDQPV